MQPRTTALLTLALLACDVDDSDDPDLREILVGGGTVFNTDKIEVAAFSELTRLTQGLHLDITLDHVTLPGAVTIDQFHLDHGEIVAVDNHGVAHQGTQLVGSEWVLVGWPNFQASMRISSFNPVNGAPYYMFERAKEFDWVSSCPVETVGNTEKTGLVRMLSGFQLDTESGHITVDKHMTFISCTTGAVGKAAMWGYYDLGIKLLESPSILSRRSRWRSGWCARTTATTANLGPSPASRSRSRISGTSTTPTRAGRSRRCGARTV